MTARELMEMHRAPPVRSLADLTPTENVWLASTSYGELYGQLAHRKASLKVAVCGVVISEWATAADHLVVLGGRLCPACWMSDEEGGA